MEPLFLNRSTLNWLKQQWENINQSAIQGRMKCPVFQIHGGNSRLGYWQQESRIMSFSKQLLECSSEYEFDLVLRHECAHQYTDEILHVQDEPPHGDAFAHACKLLGIHRFSRMGLNSKPSKIASKIKKLLQLALSDNPNEASLAAKRAQELMLKHNVGVEDTHYVFHHLARFSARRRAVDRRLISTINDHFSIYSIWIQSPKIEKDGYLWHVEIMGLRHHIEIASYTYDYLSREIERQWQKFRKANQTRSGDKRSFQLGLIAGLDKNLSGDQPDNHQGNTLLVIKEKALLDFAKTRYPKVSHRTDRGNAVSNTYRDGFTRGMHLDIRKGVKTGHNPLRLSK